MLNRVTARSLKLAGSLSGSRGFTHARFLSSGISYTEDQDNTNLSEDFPSGGYPTSLEQDGSGNHFVGVLDESGILEAVKDPSPTPALPRDDSVLEAIGLGHWSRKVGFLSAFAAAAVGNEWYVINEETMVAGCLSSAFLCMYIFSRQGVVDWYEQEKSEILTAQTDAEKRHAAAAQAFIDATSGGSGDLSESVKAVVDERIALIDAEHEAALLAERHAVRNTFDRKLQSLVNEKKGERKEQYLRVVDEVTAAVRADADSNAFRKRALAFAINSIKASPDKGSTSPVPELFMKTLEKRMKQ